MVPRYTQNFSISKRLKKLRWVGVHASNIEKIIFGENQTNKIKLWSASQIEGFIAGLSLIEV